MREFFASSSYFGVSITLLFFALGLALKKKFNWALLNPLLVASALTIALLLALDIDYDSYNASANLLSYLLTPATVCLAVPLYQNLSILRKNIAAILCGIFSGVVANIALMLLLAVAFGLTHEQYVTLLPKSITTAIGMGVSQELGGTVSLTIAVIILTGIFANISAEFVFRVFRVKDPVAKGVALGTAGHAIGTSKANELGKTEGAVSSLAIAVTGLMSVVMISLAAGLV